MRESSRRSSKNKNRVRLALIAGAVLLFLWYVVPRLLFGAAALVILPIVSIQSWFYESTASLPQFLRDRSELVEEMQRLEQQVLERSGDQHSLELLKSENEELRNLLSYDGSERIMAGVIARPNQLPYDVLLIDQGSRDGVLEGSPVYIGNQTVIGFVSEVLQRSSVVTLVTTPGFTSTVFVFGPDIYTNAVGQGGGKVRVGVPQGIALEVGDLVVLPAVTSGIYGDISYIETSPTQPEQYGFVSPEIPLQSIRFVAVGGTPLTGTNYNTARNNVEAAFADLFNVPVPADVLVTLGATSTATTTNASSSVQTTPVETATSTP